MSSQIRRFEERIIHEVLLIVGMVVLALAQVTLLPAPLGFTPALLLIVVVGRALIGIEQTLPGYEAIATVRWAFYGGIALDLCSATPLGSHALALILATVAVVIIARLLNVHGPLLTLIAVLLAALVYEATLALIYSITVTYVDWQTYLLFIILPSTLIALIPSLPIFVTLRWLAQRTTGDA